MGSSSTENMTLWNDTYLDELNSDTDQGLLNYLDVTGSVIGGKEISLLKFKINIPSDSIINSARLFLKLYQGEGLIDNVTIDAYQITGNWNSTWTWNNGIPTHEVTAEDSVRIECTDINCNNAEGTWFNWSIKTMVQEITNSSGNNISIMLNGTPANDKLRQFYSQDSIIASPFLEINYTNATCYQEQANISTACGGVDNGYYGVQGTMNPPYLKSLCRDGIWNDSMCYAGNSQLLNVYYEKPFGATGATVIYGVGYTNGSASTNYSYDLGDDCFNFNSTHIHLRWDNIAVSNIYVDCENSTAVRTVDAIDGNGLTEEAIMWTGAHTAPPSAPTILTPNTSAYEEMINISYTAAVPNTFTNISYYKIALINENNSTNLTISANVGLNLSVLWNSSVVKNKNWRINVTAVDNTTYENGSISATFSTHNYIVTPTITAVYSGQNAICNFTIYDSDTIATLTAYVNLYKNNATASSQIKSVSNNISDGTTFLSSLFETGDELFCSIRPYDNVFQGFARNSSTTTILLSPNISFTNCTSNNSTFNINVLEENTLKPMTAKVEALIQYKITQNAPIYSNYSTIYSGNTSYSICINQTAYANIYLIYAGNFTQRWYLYNLTLNASNYTQNFTIYNWANNTGISTLKITVRDNSSYSLFPNIVGRLQRYYAGEGVWRTVQMDKSAEDGETLYNIREIDTDYRLQYYDTNNHLLRQTESSKWVCTAGLCEATALVPSYSSLAAATTETTWSYNNNTKIITTQWNDINIQTVNSVVSKETASGTQILCNETVLASSGSIQCNITSYQGEIKLQTFINGQEIPVITEWIDTKASTLRDLIGESESTFWTVAIVITTAMAGLISPAAVIIFTMFGLVLTYLLGLFAPLTIPMITIACVLGLVIAMKVKY
jgi:hypothetical protein